MFSPHERRLLLAYARQILEYEFSGPGSGTPPLPPVEDLKRDGCCFVTLYEGGEIRGCIGNCEAFESFADNLARNVLNAAFSDPGFPPLEPEELPEIRLEISIPGAPEPVRFECAHPEREGLLLRYGERRALFLPQIVRQQGWDRESTLQFLMRKAGIAPEISPEKCAEIELFRFEVESFAE